MIQEEIMQTNLINDEKVLYAILDYLTALAYNKGQRFIYADFTAMGYVVF